MLAINLSGDDAPAALGYENRLSIAASAARSQRCAGDVDALEEMNAALQKKNALPPVSGVQRTARRWKHCAHS